MNKWTYFVESIHASEFNDTHFNKLGEQGWELVGFKVETNNAIFRAVFKKPFEDSNA